MSRVVAPCHDSGAGGDVRVRVTNAVSGKEMLATTSLPRQNVVRRLRVELGSRPSRPVEIFQAGALAGEEFEVPQHPVDGVLPFTAIVSDALTEQEREELLRSFTLGYSLLLFLGMSPAARDDKVIALEAIHQDGCGRILQFASETLQGDFDVVLASVRQHADAFAHASQALRGDRAILMAALARHPWAFARASDSLKDDKALALRVVQMDGNLLAFASEGVQDSRKVVLAAVEQCGAALQHASPALRGDPGIVRAAEHCTCATARRSTAQKRRRCSLTRQHPSKHGGTLRGGPLPVECRRQWRNEDARLKRDAEV